MKKRDSAAVRDSERRIFNRPRSTGRFDPDQKLMVRLLAERDSWIRQRLDSLPPGTTVLDVGCGMGGLTLDLARRGFSVTGIDIAEYRIECARRAAAELGVAIRLLVGDAERLCFKPASFDLIFCAAILHHLPEVENSLVGFRRLLRDGGSIIAIEPGLLNPFAWIRRTFFPSPIHTPDEHPFVPFHLVRMFRRHFSRVECARFSLLSLAAPGVQKLLGDRAGYLSLSLLRPVDSVLTRIPFIRELSKSICVHAYW